MTPADQAAVRSVAAASPLARFWPDLLNPGLIDREMVAT